MQNSQTQSNQLLLEVQGVGVSFGVQQVLQDISFTVSKQQIVTLIGPNGAGKSTLLKVVLGLLRPTCGKVVRRSELTVGYIPQKTVFNVQMPINVRRFLSLTKKAKRSIAAIIDELQLTKLAQTQINKLSGGELQRVLLAKALLQEPQLLVLDEPAAGIDLNGQAALYDLILQLKNKMDCGVLMTSHDLHMVMAGTTTVMCLNKHICCRGSPADVSQHPQFVQLFGARLAEQLAVYKHRHDHQHGLDGKIIK